MPVWVQWVLVIALATTVDLLVRFRIAKAFVGVLWGEAVLFSLTGLALVLLLRSHPRLTGTRRTLQVVLVWAFFLAAVRSGVWAAGFPVGLANLLVFVAALGGWLVFRLRKRRGQPS